MLVYLTNFALSFLTYVFKATNSPLNTGIALSKKFFKFPPKFCHCILQTDIVLFSFISKYFLISPFCLTHKLFRSTLLNFQIPWNFQNNFIALISIPYTYSSFPFNYIETILNPKYNLFVNTPHAL